LPFIFRWLTTFKVSCCTTPVRILSLSSASFVSE